MGQRAVPAAHAEAPPHLLSPGRRGALPSPGTPDGRNRRRSQARPPLHLTGDQERRLPVAQSGPGPDRHPCETSRISLFARSRHCCSYQNQLKLLLRGPRSLSAFVGSGSRAWPGTFSGCRYRLCTDRAHTARLGHGGDGMSESGWGCRQACPGAWQPSQEKVGRGTRPGPEPSGHSQEGVRQEEGPQPPCRTPTPLPAQEQGPLPRPTGKALATRPTLTTPAPPRDRPSLGSLSTRLSRVHCRRFTTVTTLWGLPPHFSARLLMGGERREQSGHPAQDGAPSFLY